MKLTSSRIITHWSNTSDVFPTDQWATFSPSIAASDDLGGSVYSGHGSGSSVYGGRAFEPELPPARPLSAVGPSSNAEARPGSWVPPSPSGSADSLHSARSTYLGGALNRVGPVSALSNSGQLLGSPVPVSNDGQRSADVDRTDMDLSNVFSPELLWNGYHGHQIFRTMAPEEPPSRPFKEES